MADLERLLREARPDWPPTPDLAGTVAARIAAGPVRRRRPRRGRLRAFLAALLVAFGATLAISPARGALLDLLGLGGVEVQRTSPSATPGPAPPSGERLGQGLSLGTAVTPAQAARLARGFAAAPPAGLGRPDATFFAAGPPESGRVSYVYRARRG